MLEKHICIHVIMHIKSSGCRRFNSKYFSLFHTDLEYTGSWYVIRRADSLAHRVTNKMSNIFNVKFRFLARMKDIQRYNTQYTVCVCVHNAMENGRGRAVLLWERALNGAMSSARMRICPACVTNKFLIRIVSKFVVEYLRSIFFSLFSCLSLSSPNYHNVHSLWLWEKVTQRTFGG